MYRTCIKDDMETERILVVALEDRRTAPAVARKAGLVAIAERTRLVVLLHVVADMVGTGLGFEPAGCWMPDGTPTEEVTNILDAAENTLHAVYAAHHQAPPIIRRVIGTGPIPEAIRRAATTNQAVGVVLGARRPHKLGLLFHPDVAARVAPQLTCPVHVAPLLHSAEAPTAHQ
jgi:nucleotide-binding universal stress UspA family protein